MCSYGKKRLFTDEHTIRKDKCKSDCKKKLKLYATLVTYTVYNIIALFLAHLPIVQKMKHNTRPRCHSNHLHCIVPFVMKTFAYFMAI